MFGRPSRVHGRICLASALLGVAALAALTAVPASASGSSASSTNPYLPSDGHPYRHGAIPSQSQEAKIRSWDAQHQGLQASGSTTGPDTVYFNGGITENSTTKIGAVTATPKVYLVFWGNQWGAQGTDSNGNLTFSGDPAHGAPYIQELFKGFGTMGELWSGTMTQYCDGSLVATGASSCPSGAPHIGYPNGNALAGVWYDNATAAPSPSTQSQIASEAIAAAQHFGNTSAASNRYAQYVVLSAHGTSPDGFLGSNWCAWHSSTTSSVGELAYTNMPYVMDAGAGCGANFVNASGALDGYSIVEGHEYAETLTDEFPNAGWVANSGSEVGDECAWISPSSAGGAADVPMVTGSFAMQSTWSNDTYSCAISHVVVTGTSANTVSVTNPGSQTGVVGTAATLSIQASDSASSQTLSYSATGLPPGLSINSGSGVITGTPTFAGASTVTVTATDTTGAQGSASFSWTVTSPNTVTVTSPGNQTTAAGTAVSLQTVASDTNSVPATLSYKATGLPSGLSINSSSGVISGSSTASGTTNVTVTATDTTGAQGSASFAWTINPSGDIVTVSPVASQSGAVGTPVSLQLHATDSAPGQTLRFSATGLPAGLQISTSGLISGTPTNARTYAVTVTATDSTGAHGSTTFTWTIGKRHH